MEGGRKGKTKSGFSKLRKDFIAVYIVVHVTLSAQGAHISSPDTSKNTTECVSLLDIPDIING